MQVSLVPGAKVASSPLQKRIVRCELVFCSP